MAQSDQIEANKYVGRKALLKFKHDSQRDEGSTLWVPVRIEQAFYRFGVLHCEIKPIGGSGRQTVRESRLKFVAG